MFLFHIGSIKSMVLTTIGHDYDCFYSILVRLKVISGVIPSERVIRFLFHIGSIKRERPDDPCEFRRCFYSILVRLKVNISQTSELSVLSSFYSILVRLKALRVIGCHAADRVSIPYWFD